MSLRSRANALTRRVNPNVMGTIYFSDGYMTDDAGDRYPAFIPSPPTAMQVQALSGREVQHLDSLNIQGLLRAVYLNGRVDGVRRLTNQGGDILAFSGSYWLVVQVLEPWDGSGWVKVAVSEQIELPTGVTPVTVCSMAAAVALLLPPEG